ncbi:hypothetical protein [Streptomyces xiamenensis]|uniref:hypothetical protein n=1 Tax=Streptomyces xiamenensis TaxID=408015 RepID=UPI0035E006CB
MDSKSRPHFPLTLLAYRTSCFAAAAYLNCGPDAVLYGDAGSYGARAALDTLSGELRLTGAPEDADAHRVEALVFAIEAAQAYHPDPRELGFHTPVRAPGFFELLFFGESPTGPWSMPNS